MSTTNTKARKFKDDLAKLISSLSLEQASNTPDFILADYLYHCLVSFNSSCNWREEWYGRKPKNQKFIAHNEDK